MAKLSMKKTEKAEEGHIQALEDLATAPNGDYGKYGTVPVREETTDQVRELVAQGELASQAIIVYVDGSEHRMPMPPPPAHVAFEEHFDYPISELDETKPLGHHYWLFWKTLTLRRGVTDSFEDWLHNVDNVINPSFPNDGELPLDQNGT